MAVITMVVEMLFIGSKQSLSIEINSANSSGNDLLVVISCVLN